MFIGREVSGVIGKNNPGCTLGMIIFVAADIAN
jgi:hypothetical protein